MKTYKDYLIDFDKLKVGDEVWSQLFGYGEIGEIRNKSIKGYPIIVYFDEREEQLFTNNGFLNTSHVTPTLFKEKPDFFKERKEVKRWRWYWEHNNKSMFGGMSQIRETEKEFLESYKIANGVVPFKYEKIDCTEIMDVVYE